MQIPLGETAHGCFLPVHALDRARTVSDGKGCFHDKDFDDKTFDDKTFLSFL